MEMDAARERLALKLAWKTWKRIRTYDGGGFDTEALRGAALLGAAKALAQFDESRGVAFRTYAISLIRGEILEEMRAQDHLPRSLRQEAKKIETRTGQPPWWANGPLSLETLTTEASDENIGRMDAVHLADHLIADVDVEAEVLQRIEDEELYEAVGWLPEPEEITVRCYYWHGETLKEIARRLNRSESRAHQYHAQALERLREFLGVEAAPRPEVVSYEHPPCVVCGGPVVQRENEISARWRQRIACSLECGWQAMARRRRQQNRAGLGVGEGR